jgi:hypothetical protein
MKPRVHPINPSRVTFGTAVITPRWLYVLAAATRTEWGDPILVDDAQHLDLSTIAKGVDWRVQAMPNVATRSVSASAARGCLRRHSFDPVSGGSARPWRGTRLVKGDGDLVWQNVVRDRMNGRPERIYDGGRVSGESFKQAR